MVQIVRMKNELKAIQLAHNIQRVCMSALWNYFILLSLRMMTVVMWKANDENEMSGWQPPGMSYSMI